MKKICVILLTAFLLSCESYVEPTYSISNLDFVKRDGLSIQKGEVEIFTTGNEYLVFFNDHSGDKTLYVLQAEDLSKMNGDFKDVEFTYSEQFFLFNPINLDKLYVFVLKDYKGIEDFNEIDQEIVLITGYGIGPVDSPDFSNLLSTLSTEFIESVYESPGTGLNNKVQGGGCDSGGEGSSSCSVADDGNRCSVFCRSGYYACCESEEGTLGVSCKCVRDTQ